MKTHIQNSFLAMVLAVTWPMLPTGALAQNLFVSDPGSGNIFEFTTNGIRTTFASGLNQPEGLAFDAHGNLFVACGGTATIYEYTTNGTQSVFSTNYLQNPTGLVFDNVGNLFVTDSRGYIIKFQTNGTPGIFASSVHGPFGLAFDSAGNLFETDNQSSYSRINEFSTNGTETNFANVKYNVNFPYPTGLAFDSKSNLFVAAAGYNNIYEFTNMSSPMSNPITFASNLNNPYGVAFDNAGNLYEADEGDGDIYEFTNNAGTLSSNPTLFASGLNHPAFIAFAPTAPTPPSPSLSIATVANKSVIFWPASATNYVLQSTTHMNSPNWTAASDAVPVTAVTVTNTSPARFFRLQQQQ